MSNYKKRADKRAELSEMTNMGYPTMADELCMDKWNEKLAQVAGLGFDAPAFAPSANASVRDGSAVEAPRLEGINESVAAITKGLDGLYPNFENKKLNESKTQESIEGLAGLTESRQGIDTALNVLKMAVKNNENTGDLFPHLEELMLTLVNTFEACIEGDQDYIMKYGRRLPGLLQRAKEDADEINADLEGL